MKELNEKILLLKLIENSPSGILIFKKLLYLETREFQVKLIYANKPIEEMLKINVKNKTEQIKERLTEYESFTNKKSTLKLNSHNNLYTDLIKGSSLMESAYPSIERYINGDRMILAKTTDYMMPDNCAENYKIMSIESLNEERKQMHNNLYKNIKSQILITISHEINNPLTGLMYSCKQMVKANGNVIKQTKLLEKIKKFKYMIKFFIKNLTFSFKIFLKEKINSNPSNLNFFVIFNNIVKGYITAVLDNKKTGNFTINLNNCKNIVLYNDYEHIKFFMKVVLMYFGNKLDKRSNFEIDTELNKNTKKVLVKFIKTPNNFAMMRDNLKDFNYNNLSHNNSNIDKSMSEEMAVENSVQTMEMLKEIINYLSDYLNIKTHISENLLTLGISYTEIENYMNESESDLCEFSPKTSNINVFNLEQLNKSINNPKLNESRAYSSSSDSRRGSVNIEPKLYTFKADTNKRSGSIDKRIEDTLFSKLIRSKKSINGETARSISLCIPPPGIVRDGSPKKTPNFKKKENFTNETIDSPTSRNHLDIDNFTARKSIFFNHQPHNQIITPSKFTSDLKNQKVMITLEEKSSHIPPHTAKERPITTTSYNTNYNIFNFNSDVNISAIHPPQSDDMSRFEIDDNLLSPYDKVNDTEIIKKRCQLASNKSVNDMELFIHNSLTNLKHSESLKNLDQVTKTPSRNRMKFMKKNTLQFKRSDKRASSEKVDDIYNNQPLTPNISTKKCDCSKLLVVDDEIFNIKTLKSMLQKHKIFPESAINGREAVDKVEDSFNKTCCNTQYKLIFMDVMMPELDGIEASREIQKLFDKRKIKEVSIVIISAHDAEDIRNRVNDMSLVKEFVPKPVKKTTIEELLHKYYFDLK